MAVNLDTLLIHIVVSTVVLSPALWLSGRIIVGRDKAKFTDAVWIVVVGTVVGTFFGVFFKGFVAAIVQLILWLMIVKHFFDCDWLKAFAISILAVILFAIIAAALALIGFALIVFI